MTDCLSFHYFTFIDFSFKSVADLCSGSEIQLLFQNIFLGCFRRLKHNHWESASLYSQAKQWFLPQSLSNLQQEFLDKVSLFYRHF